MRWPLITFFQCMYIHVCMCLSFNAKIRFFDKKSLVYSRISLNMGFVYNKNEF